ncbi:MAG: hypothetical protein IKQ64_03320 [Bacteroidales bacterium]|nr:hypothetical protein [Bacteroidales bacterium]
MKIVKLFGILAVCCLSLAAVSCSKDDSWKKDDGGKQDEAVTSLKGTTWATGEQLGIGTLTLSFTDKEATLKRVSEGKTTSYTYPYTFSKGTMKTKGKLLNDKEQDITGTVSGKTMNVTFSSSGNYIFSKK